MVWWRSKFIFSEMINENIPELLQKVRLCNTSWRVDWITKTQIQKRQQRAVKEDLRKGSSWREKEAPCFRDYRKVSLTLWSRREGFKDKEDSIWKHIFHDSGETYLCLGRILTRISKEIYTPTAAKKKKKKMQALNRIWKDFCFCLILNYYTKEWVRCNVP